MKRSRNLALVILIGIVQTFPLHAATWNINANGNWSRAASWSGNVPNAAGSEAVFGGIITAPRTVTVDVPITVGRIVFDNTNAYTIAGNGPLQINNGGPAAIQVLTW